MATDSVLAPIPGDDREVLFDGLVVNTTSARLITLTNVKGLR